LWLINTWANQMPPLTSAVMRLGHRPALQDIQMMGTR
jgi:hypothetical protein